MAVYEYRCQKCSRAFEAMRPMSQADAPATCPRCGGKGQRLISVFASNQDSGLQVPSKEPLRAALPRSGPSKAMRHKAGKASKGAARGKRRR
ncbi:MAG: zinc ribbon domain-containing protein [Chloroflexi bacterium]|nr:zinc ribbon domain-containing protein [Chloroflexota bacterium]